jgi:restriction system protein
MGAIWLSTEEFFEGLSERIGYKSGLVLDATDIRGLLKSEPAYEEYAALAEDDGLRIRSEVYEGVFEYLLFRVGRLESPVNLPPVAHAYHRYKNDKKKLKQAMAIESHFTAFLEKALDSPENKERKAIDPIPFILEMGKEFGASGMKMAFEAVDAFSLALFRSPWGVQFHHFENVIELRDLFNSEGLTPLYGKFIDQRYLDFLNRNFGAIDSIHWRKFEGLTGEFFDRAGFCVELGPGRNDEGVDVRVWPKAKAPDDPPAIIIQCKRQKEHVGKVVVKALYADILSERAQSGLIVTTTRLSRGAKAVCTARNYPIEEADRSTLKDWIGQLRKPGHGSFL